MIARAGWPGVVIVSLFALGPADAAEPARGPNVILMIADGGGYTIWEAAALYEGTRGREFYDAQGWVRGTSSTYALRRQTEPPVSADLARVQNPFFVYDPLRAWDPTPEPGGEGAYPFYFAGYKWLRQTAPDSANTMSTLVTGQKTYSGSINTDGAKQPIVETLARIAHERGKGVGVVTSVPFSHATPAAAAGAHHGDRNRYCMLAVEMLTADYPDVIAGCGNPDFDNNGLRLTEESARDYDYVGGKDVWAFLNGEHRLLKAGHVVCNEPGAPDHTVLDARRMAALSRLKLVQSRAAIEALGQGDLPDRLLLVPEIGQVVLDRATHEGVGGTLQQQRGSRADPRLTPPGYDPPVATVPSLETLTEVALNALDDRASGFFLHVEGGAVDWAMHANQLGRAIEELADFKRAVHAVSAWVEAHGGWDETLLIVTADHDHLLWGPKADEVPFSPLEDRGAGKLPGHRWLSNGHSNALVPVFARGRGAERIAELSVRRDPYRGAYLDQVDLYTIMRSVLEGR